MTDRNYLYQSFRPSRRTCIRGPFCRGKCCLNMATKSHKNNGTQEADNSAENLTFSKGRAAGDGSSDVEKSVDNSDASQNSSVQPNVDAVDGTVLNSSGRSLSWSQHEGSPFSGSGDGPQRSHSAQHLDKNKSFESYQMNQESQGSKFNQNNNKSENIRITDIHKEKQNKSDGRNSQPKVCQQNYERPERVIPLIERIATALEYNTDETEHTNSNWMMQPFVFCIALALLFAVFNSASMSTSDKPGYGQSDFQQELNKIGKEHNINSDTMLEIQTGIETTFKKQDTLSVVFLYNTMDEELVKEIVNKVANASAKFLRNKKDLAPIIVKTSDFNVGTSEELIDKYKEELLNQGVLLVQDLENIPVNLAMAFHYYCDETDPLVKNTAIFFTLNLAKCRKTAGRTQHQMAESCLTDKWGTLDNQEKLAPLLARIVSVVVDLENGIKQ